MKDYTISLFIGEPEKPVAELPTHIIHALLDPVTEPIIVQALQPTKITLEDFLERLRIELVARELGL